MPSNRYTVEQMTEAIQTSTSIRQVLLKLGLSGQGGTYKVVHKFIAKYDIDISHFKGQGWNKGENFGPKRPIEDYLSNKYSITSHKLRKRLLKEGYFESRCYKCMLSEWNGQPIPLELEHLDGNHNNNSLSNLTILCPNCHAQTPTYRRQKRK